MLTSHELKIVISAVTQGLGDVRKMAGEFTTGAQKVRAAGKAFRDTMRDGRREAGLLAGQLRGLLTGLAAFASVSKVTRIVADADNAMFGLKTSVAAANREFGNTGTIADWEAGIGRLSKQLRIYSETELKNAAARTVDMTKRLGLTRIQMEEVIRRSGDLGAGKVELEGAVERVTAALRGEAEAAEFLGLTLNENYVKAQYEANAANQKAWKDLTDLEKAQARYVEFLKQSEQMLGRAAKSAETFAGAWKSVTTAVEDSIAKNKNVADALAGVARTLRENETAIAGFVADVVELAGQLLKAAVEYRKFLAVLAGTAAAVYAVNTLVRTVKALNAAMVVLTGTGILGGLSSLRGAIAGVAMAGGAAGTALTAGAAAAAAWGGYQIFQAIKAFREMRDAQESARESQERMIATSDKALASLAKFKGVKLPADLTGQAPEQLRQLQWELQRARDYYQVLITRMNATGETAGLADAEARLADIRGDLEKIGEAAKAALEKPVTAVQATTEQLDEFQKKAEEAYESAKEDARRYAEEIDKINARIADRAIDTEDKIRELRRQTMTEEQQAEDVRLQAMEKVRAAQEALNQYQATGNDRARDSAQRFFDDAGRLWEQYAREGKGATEEAVTGLEEIKRGLDVLDQANIGWLEKMKREAEVTMATIEQQLTELTRDREAKIHISLERLADAQKAINDLLLPATKHITVVTHTVEQKAAGGPAGGFPRRAGRLPGFGGGDRIRALLEAGEFVIRKEAVAKYGAGLFAALNGLRLPLPDIAGQIRAQLGGLVGALPRFAAGGPVAPAERMILELTAGGASLPLTVSGPRAATRAAVRQFEAELRRMRLSHSGRG